MRRTSSCATDGLAFSIGARLLSPTRSPGSSTRSATSRSGGDSSPMAERCSGFDPSTSSPGRLRFARSYPALRPWLRARGALRALTWDRVLTGQSAPVRNEDPERGRLARHDLPPGHRAGRQVGRLKHEPGASWHHNSFGRVAA